MTRTYTLSGVSARRMIAIEAHRSTVKLCQLGSSFKVTDAARRKRPLSLNYRRLCDTIAFTNTVNTDQHGHSIHWNDQSIRRVPLFGDASSEDLRSDAADDGTEITRILNNRLMQSYE
jgi:hypothetical protein